jgi:hypothetical protein
MDWIVEFIEPPPSFTGFATAPLSSRTTCAAVFVSYLILVFSIKSLGLSLKLKVLFFLHNAMLSIASGILLIAFCVTLFPILVKGGFYDAICSIDSYTVFLTYLSGLVETRVPILSKLPL